MIKYCKFCKQDRDAANDFYSYHPNKCKLCIYQSNRKNTIKKSEWTQEYQKLYRRQYRKNMDAAAKLRKNVSRVIGRALSSGKGGESCTKYLPYSFQELKEHLEKQFESWMTWENYGSYDSKVWNDEDQSTWTWNIDHVIPQSKFQYETMRDTAFKECWALNNLRPFSSKDNFLQGVKRSRH